MNQRITLTDRQAAALLHDESSEFHTYWHFGCCKEINWSPDQKSLLIDDITGMADTVGGETAVRLITITILILKA
ncbi:MAG: hypothetical protein ACI88C_000011 [Acidimicrobiales bacterium]|jgi:hypothetical protein